MGWIQQLRDVFGTKTQSSSKTAVHQEVNTAIHVSPLCSTYENVFAQVRPLIDELKTVRPYGVGRNGARLPMSRTPELQVLDYPNEEMGWAEFADLMFATWLTETELNIHVWKKQNGRIFGYTILPKGSRVSKGNGDYYFRVQYADGSSEDISTDEVMTLRYSRSPSNLSEGVSPASSVFIWSQVDDLLAQYQRAFLENGAVPATITTIRASTPEKYQKVRKELEGQLRGAENQNKTVYVWEQMLDTGESLPQIEVKPIQGNNSTLALKEIMSIVNDKLNKAYGVSEFILGNDSSAKYDNAELSDRQFTKRRVYPALLSFWSQFQHELTRVKGGLPYAIQFDLEIPELSDRLKVKTEISSKNVENLTNLINSGASPLAALKALELGEEWAEVAIGLANEKRTQAELQKTVATTTEVITQESADTDVVKNTTDKHKHCHHCHTCDNKTMEEVIFAEDEETEKKIYDQLTIILNSVLNSAEGKSTLSAEDKKKIRLAIMSELLAIADGGANAGATEIAGQVVGATKEEISQVLENGGYHVSDEFRERLERRTEELVNRLDEKAQEVAKEVLSNREGLTKTELKKALADVMPAARAETIARNETAYAFRAGHLENDKYMAQKYGLKLRKIWRISREDACEICKAMDGQVVEIDEAFPDSVDGKDGIRYSWEHTSWNDKGEIPSAHVDCRCHYETEVIRD
ncbi:MAG: phage portal protein [Lachnospiraceae bacterium]|nr:phage portal protein [Lachnospiraceae bacterium]